jgi:predicted PurR-regulated permease PerM
MILFGGDNPRAILVYGLVVLAILAFSYFVIIKPITDTTNNTVNNAFKQAAPLFQQGLKQEKQAARQAQQQIQQAQQRSNASALQQAQQQLKQAQKQLKQAQAQASK